MSKLTSVIQVLHARGVRGILQQSWRSIYSSRTWILFEKQWDPDDQRVDPSDGQVMLREGTTDDVDRIVAVWPPEFEQPPGLANMLRERFEKGEHCFLAMAGDDVIGGVWCKPWVYDDALPPAYRGRKCYELWNGFVTPRARGKGVAGRLWGFTMQEMAAKGVPVTYGRVSPKWQASVSACGKLGFRALGMLKTGVKFGRLFARLTPGDPLASAGASGADSDGARSGGSA